MYIHLFIYRYISRLYLYMYICIHIYIYNFYLQLLNYRLLLKFVYTHSVRGLYANQTVGFTNEKAIFGLRDPASVPEQWWSGWIISRTQAVGDTWLLRYVHGSGVYCAESGLKHGIYQRFLKQFVTPIFPKGIPIKKCLPCPPVFCSQLAEDRSQFCAVWHVEGPEAQRPVQAGGQHSPLEEGAGSWQNVEFFAFCDRCGPSESQQGQV